MGRRTSLERVVHLMCELYLRTRNVGLEFQPDLKLPLSQLLLADSLGMTPMHVNRILKTLRLSGAMTRKRGSLHIVDPAKLLQIASFDENYLRRRIRRSASVKPTQSKVAALTQRFSSPVNPPAMTMTMATTGTIRGY